MIDRLLRNAFLYTMDRRRPRATVLGLRGTRIVFLGDEIPDALMTKDTIVEDLGGATVVPGMVDAHIHWQWTAISLRQVSLAYLRTKREALERLARAAASLAPGAWLAGRGWAQGDWIDTGGAFPNAADLDAIVPNNPVFLSARSGHAAWINSEAMRRAGITRDTPDPADGTIERDARGKPTGILFEGAIEIARRAVPPPTTEDIVAAMEEAQQRAWRCGLTGVHDYDGPAAFNAMQVLRERGRLGMRIVKNIDDPWIHHAHALGLRWGFGDAWLRIGGLKMFSDGALGSVTALMLEPIEGQPDNLGIRVMEPDRMYELAAEATRRGIPSTIHAIGDRAMREVLDVLERVRAEEQRLGIAREERRHRIEHVQLLHPDDEPRLAQLDVIASMQPIHATADMEMADKYWGKRSAHGYNPRVQLDHGARVVFGSDAPVEPMEPLKTIHAAVTRRRADGSPGPDGWYPDARVTVEEALRAYTAEPAYAAGTEKLLGRLLPGFLADLVVLERDPHVVDPHTIKDIPVLGTMIGGEWKWRDS